MSKAGHGLTTPYMLPLMQRAILAAQNYDISTVAGLIEDLGGKAVVARALDVHPTDVQRWIISGAIPPGWHLRLFGLAALLGKSVNPALFLLAFDDPASVGLNLLMSRAYREGGAHG